LGLLKTHEDVEPNVEGSMYFIHSAICVCLCVCVCMGVCGCVWVGGGGGCKWVYVCLCVCVCVYVYVSVQCTNGQKKAQSTQGSSLIPSRRPSGDNQSREPTKKRKQSFSEKQEMVKGQSSV